jgi:hypothetical protein
MMDNLFFFGLRGYGEREICLPLKAAQTSRLLALGWRRILLYYSYRLLISVRCSGVMDSHLQGLMPHTIQHIIRIPVYLQCWYEIDGDVVCKSVPQKDLLN